MDIITNRLMPQITPQPLVFEKPTLDQATAFHQWLYAGAPTTDPGSLSPQQMLVRQINTAGITVGVDLGAKIAGALSQSLNKLVNMA